MKKNILKLIPIALALTLTSCNNSNNNECNYLQYSYNKSTKEATVTGISDLTITNVVIPSEVVYESTTYKVAYIGESAFKQTDSTSVLESITLSDNIKEIKSEAFYKCKNLRYIKLSNTLEKINTSAFSGCTNLVNIEIPSTVSYLGSKVFKDCTSLKSIYLPDNINKLLGYTFSGCTSLTNLYSISLNSLSSSDFTNCKALSNIYYSTTTLPKVDGTNSYYESASKHLSCTLSVIDNDYYYILDHVNHTAYVSGVKDLNNKDIVIKDSIEFMNEVYIVNGIYQYAFYNTSLNSATLSDNVKTLGKYSFYNSNLSSIDLSNVEILEEYALAYNNISELKFSDNANLKEGALSYCTNLKNVELPLNTSYISKYLFKGDTLDYVIINHAVSLINVSAFEDATINKLYYTSSEDDFKSITNNDSSHTANIEIEYNYTK